MPQAVLADFLEALSARRELLRVGVEVDPAHELAEIARRVAQAGGPALLFDRLRGSSQVVVANLLGTVERACHALGVSRLEELDERSGNLLRQGAALGWLERLKLSPEAPATEKFRPKTARSAACQQIVRLGTDVDLRTLAIVQTWPGETNRSITAAQLVFTNAAGVRRIVPVRLVLVDPARVAIVDDGTGEWTRFCESAKAEQRRLPVAVFLGGDPAWRIAAAVPTAESLDSYVWLGMVRGAAMELVKGRSDAQEVPAGADIVLEGFVDPAAEHAQIVLGGVAGPYYRAPLSAPVLLVEVVTQRSTCVLPVAIDGVDCGETAVIRKAVERILLPLVKGAIPELVDYALPVWGGSDRFALVAIQKTIPLQARRAASALWGLPAFGAVKFVVIVDEDVDVQNAAEVWARVGANIDPGRDVFVTEGPASNDDHAFAVPLVGRHVGIDATRKLAGETSQPAPEILATSSEIRELVDRRWKEYKL